MMTGWPRPLRRTAGICLAAYSSRFVALSRPCTCWQNEGFPPPAADATGVSKPKAGPSPSPTPASWPGPPPSDAATPPCPASTPP